MEQFAEECTVWLSQSMEAELANFNPETGRFMVGDGWAVTCQDVMLSLAYLYLTPHPQNRFFRNAETLEIIGKAGDALRDFQYPDGRVEFVKVDGSKWGPIYMPWSMFHWVETYRLLREEFSRERKARWEEGLQLAFEGIDREMKALLQQGEDKEREGTGRRESVVHNIPVWNGMSLHRASQVLNRPEWGSTAEQMIRLAVKAQHPDGYWVEHHGPTTLYNTVYIHSLGLYHCHGGEVDVMPALEKALAFHEVFTYPDGTMVETVDGRVKYHDHPSAHGLPGFALVPRGKRYVKSIVRSAMQQKADWKSPHFASLLLHWTESETETAPTLFERESFRVKHAEALATKAEGWYVCLSGYTTPKVESRWGQDRQSFVGVWNQASGLVIGGGNSKDQPEWSTFELHTPEGEVIAIPHRGTADLDRQQVELIYGKSSLEVQLADCRRDQVVIRFRARLSAGEKGLVHLPLRLHTGNDFATSLTRPEPLSSAELRVSAGQGSHWLRHNGWEIRLDGAFRLDWPSFPFNPYAMDGKADIKEAVAILTLPVENGEERQVTICI